MKATSKLQILFLSLPVTLIAGAQTASNYQGVSLISATDIPYPPEARMAGMVTLDVAVKPSGDVQNVEAVRDIPPLTKAAQDSVRQWKFNPAQKGDQPVAGTIRVNVVFNPFNPSDVSIPNKPLPPPENANANAAGVFRPPDVKSANYAVYPPNTVARGTVVLDVQVAPDGSLQGVHLVRGISALSSVATKAVKDWQFIPATYESKPIAADEIIAFVFVAPEIGTM